MTDGEITVWVIVLVAIAIACVGYFAHGCYIADKEADTARMHDCVQHGGSWVFENCVGPRPDSSAR